MTKSLVIHLGDHKIGSTCIHEALYLQNWKCEGVSIVYPTLGRDNSNVLASSLVSQNKGNGWERKFSVLSGHIGNSEADVPVISAEKFENVDPAKQIKAVAEHLPEHVNTVRLILNVRPHLGKLASLYAERIKQGKFIEILSELYRETVMKDQGMYYNRFYRYREVFGLQFVLRPMIRN